MEPLKIATCSGFTASRAHRTFQYASRVPRSSPSHLIDFKRFSLAKIATASSFCLAIFGALAGLLVAFSAQAASCSYTCTNSVYTGATTVEDATCDVGCAAACITNCQNSATELKAGCYNWRCSNGPASAGGGDACAASAFSDAVRTSSAETTRVADRVSSLITSDRTSREVGETFRCFAGTPADPNLCVRTNTGICPSSYCCTPRGARAAADQPVLCKVTCTNGTHTESNMLQSACERDRGCFQLCDNFCHDGGDPTRYRGSYGGGCYSFSCGGEPQTPQPNNCGVVSITAPSSESAKKTARTNLANRANVINATASTWTCQLPRSGLEGGCVSGGCPSPSPAASRCCPPGSGTSAGQEAGACADRALAATAADKVTPEQFAQLERSTQTQKANWTCARVCDESARSTRCVKYGCPGQSADFLCCAPNTPVSAQACQRTAGAGSRGGTGGRFALPACIEDGNCSLNEIVNTGVDFANFLLGLGAALFLTIIVWAGFKYVFYAYDSSKVTEAKTMLKNALIGLLLMIGASTLIRFVHEAVTGTAGTSGGACVRDMGPTYSCQPVADTKEALRSRRCVAGKCPGAENFLCCQIEGSQTEQPAGAAGGTTGGGTSGRCAVTCTGTACRTGDAARSGCVAGGGTFDGTSCTFTMPQANCTAIDAGTASGYEDRPDRNISATFTP